MAVAGHEANKVKPVRSQVEMPNWPVKVFLPSLLLAATSLVPAVSLIGIDLYVLGKPKDAPLCAEAKYDIAKGIIENKGWFTEGGSVIKSSSNPFPGAYSYGYGLTPGRGQVHTNFTEINRKAAYELLGNSGLLQGYANKIIKSCPEIAKVSFGIANSGYWVEFFKFPDGSVRQKVCLPDPGGPRGWGYGWCD